MPQSAPAKPSDSEHIHSLSIKDFPLPSFICNDQGIVLEYNNEFAQLLQLKSASSEQQLWTDLIGLNDQHLSQLSLNGSFSLLSMSSFSGRTIDCFIKLKDGSRRNAVLAQKMLPDEEASKYCFSIIEVKKEKLSDRDAFLSAIVTSSDDAIISKNLDGFIMSWNRGAERVFGYTESEMIGKPITLLIPESRLTEETHILKEIRAGKKIDPFETIRLHKSGQALHISLAVSPIVDDTGTIIGASKIARDISDQIRIKKAVAQYTTDLETLNTISKSISEKLDSQKIVREVVEAVAKITEADTIALFYFKTDQLGHSHVLHDFHGSKPFIQKATVAIIHKIMETRPDFLDTLILPQSDPDQKLSYPQLFDELHQLSGCYQLVSLPILFSKTKVAGRLFLGFQEDKFSAQHQYMIDTIASQASVALDNTRLYEEVIEANGRKDEFIGLASHELKTPLTSINGYLQILEQSTEEPLAKKFISKALAQTGKLNSLITDLLDVTRIDAGKLHLEPEEFCINQLITDVLDTYGHTHTEHRFIFESEREDVHVLADRQRIEQVLINLLNNAIKYSPKKLDINIQLQATTDSWSVAVQDEGVGISAQQIEQLFTRFYRAHTPFRVSGMGLGLYISKQIIERHGGDITVNSVPGEGSNFKFVIPMKMIAQ